MIKNERHRFASSKVFKSSKNLPLPNGNWAAIRHEINKSPNKFKETSDENSICFNQWLSVRNLSSTAQVRLEPFENSFSFFQFKTVVMCVSGRMNMYWVLLLYMQSSKKCVLWICREDHNDDECFGVVLVSLDYKLKRPHKKGMTSMTMKRYLITNQLSQHSFQYITQSSYQYNICNRYIGLKAHSQVR